MEAKDGRLLALLDDAQGRTSLYVNDEVGTLDVLELLPPALAIRVKAFEAGVLDLGISKMGRYKSWVTSDDLGKEVSTVGALADFLRANEEIDLIDCTIQVEEIAEVTSHDECEVTLSGNEQDPKYRWLVSQLIEGLGLRLDAVMAVLKEHRGCFLKISPPNRLEAIFPTFNDYLRSDLGR